MVKDYVSDEFPLERAVPAPIHATPAQLAIESNEEPTWWRPGWHDVKHLVGWRWLLLLPAVIVLLLFAGGWYFVPLRGAAIAIGFKLGLVVFAFAVSLIGYVTRMAIRARSEPFCIFCGYSLIGLPDNYRCPECGRPYTHALIAEYRKDPNWFIERWKQSKRVPDAPKAFESGSTPRRRRATDGTE